MIPDIDRVTAPDYLADLASAPLAELRQRRAECAHLENAASYVRRFAQARLDLVVERVAAESATARESVDSDSGAGEAKIARPPQGFEPDDLSDSMIAQLDAIVAPDLSGVDEISDDDLSTLIGKLSAFEQTISQERRDLHGVIDALQAEVVRRYRDGEASVDELLSS